MTHTQLRDLAKHIYKHGFADGAVWGCKLDPPHVKIKDQIEVDFKAIDFALYAHAIGIEVSND